MVDEDGAEKFEWDSVGILPDAVDGTLPPSSKAI